MRGVVWRRVRREQGRGGAREECAYETRFSRTCVNQGTLDQLVERPFFSLEVRRSSPAGSLSLQGERSERNCNKTNRTDPPARTSKPASEGT